MSIRNRHLMDFCQRIRTEMLKQCDRVYLREAEEKKTFPYVVFDVRTLTDVRVTLELDLWGTRPGEKTLADLADNLEEALDGLAISEPEFIAALYTNNDLKWVNDDDKDIKHVNLSFTATYQA